MWENKNKNAHVHRRRNNNETKMECRKIKAGMGTCKQGWPYEPCDNEKKGGLEGDETRSDQRLSPNPLRNGKANDRSGTAAAPPRQGGLRLEVIERRGVRIVVRNVRVNE